VKKLSLVTVLSLATIVLVSTLSPVAHAQGPDVYFFDCNDIGMVLDAYHPGVTLTIWGEFKDTYLTVPMAYFVVEPGQHNYISLEPWSLGLERDEYHVVSIQSTDGFQVDYSEGPVTCGVAPVRRLYLPLLF
jgi:hypothetical protein